MQDRYAGDIGDYVKFGLLRALSAGRKLGVAWYLHPDEKHNDDGKHINYREKIGKWRNLDPELFDAMASIASHERSIATLERKEILQATYSGTRMLIPERYQDRHQWRQSWFNNVLSELSKANIVFADPDNGIVDDNPARRTRKTFAKSIPLNEVFALAAGRTAVIYHHNTRRKGGHDLEVDYWLDELGMDAIAVRAKAYSCRTFFIINPDHEIKERAEAFCDRWSQHSVVQHSRSAL